MTMLTRLSVAAAAATLLVAACVAAEVGRLEPEAQKFEVFARKFDFTPEEIKVKKGVPVDLELTTLDRLHGFNAPGLGLRAQIVPGETTHVRFTPDKVGRFILQCDIFCGDGHEGMDAAIVVEE